jgi:hypothetical protein
MTMNSMKADRPGRKSPWFEIARVLLIVALAAALYLLGQSMVLLQSLPQQQRLLKFRL